MNKEIIKEFREKFGGDAWLGADRKVVEQFLLKALASQRKGIIEKIEKWARENYEFRMAEEIINLIK